MQCNGAIQNKVQSQKEEQRNDNKTFFMERTLKTKTNYFFLSALSIFWIIS